MLKPSVLDRAHTPPNRINPQARKFEVRRRQHVSGLPLETGELELEAMRGAPQSPA